MTAEWDRWLRSDAPFEGEWYQLFGWSHPAELDPPPPPRDLRAEAAPGHEAFDALRAEANRLEILGPLVEVRGLLDAAGELEHDTPRAAELALARLRLAARLGEEDEALRAWQALNELCDGLDAHGDTAYLLAGALLVAPMVEQPLSVVEPIARLWAEDRLALPEDAPTLLMELDFDLSLRSAFARGLQEAAALPEELRRGIEQAEGRRRTRALLDLLDLDPPQATASPRALGPFGDRERLLLVRRVGEATQMRLVPRADLEREMLAVVQDQELVPPDFLVDFGHERRGQVLRQPVELLGPALTFGLRHLDPESVSAAEGMRLAFLQGGLGIMALLVACGTLWTVRALGRERRLAGLRSAFIANVSHELRTPLSSILLMAENLELDRVAGGDARRRYHGLIRREAQRLRRLVDDVLDFARIERGQGARLKAEEIDLEAFAGDLEAEVRRRVEGEGAALDFRRNGLPEKMTADGEALRRAVLNLVDNALKHSGGRTVDLSLRTEAGELWIAVGDRGRGVPAERAEEVFTPFARLEVDGEAAAGAGLGLAIVREIAQAHGGRARVRARDDGPGAVFELRVPLEGPEEASA